MNDMKNENTMLKLAKEWLSSTDSATQGMVSMLITEGREYEKQCILETVNELADDMKETVDNDGKPVKVQLFADTLCSLIRGGTYLTHLWSCPCGCSMDIRDEKYEDEHRG